MGSKSSASLALFLVFNLLFFTLVVGSNSGSSSGSCGTCPSPRPRPNPTPNPSPNPSSSSNRCPVDALKLGVCANVLAPLLGITIGTPPRTPCCSLIGNLVDLEAALCLCIAIRANILGINLNIPLSLSLLLNFCGQNVPRGFQCPN